MRKVLEELIIRAFGDLLVKMFCIKRSNCLTI